MNPPTSVDERVDVWSLGCTAYVLAFGDNPFESPVEGVQLDGLHWQAITFVH